MQLLSYPDLKLKGIPWSRQHIHRLVRAKKFPAPIKVGENTNAWIEAEIEDYLRERASQRRTRSADVAQLPGPA